MTQERILNIAKHIAIDIINGQAQTLLGIAATLLIRFNVTSKISVAELKTIYDLAVIIANNIKAVELPKNVRFSIDGNGKIVAYKTAPQRNYEPTEIIFLRVLL